MAKNLHFCPLQILTSHRTYYDISILHKQNPKFQPLTKSFTYVQKGRQSTAEGIPFSLMEIGKKRAHSNNRHKHDST